MSALFGRRWRFSSPPSQSTLTTAQDAPLLRPLLGPSSSRFECLKQCCMFRMADCGLRRIAAL
eukprot:1908529-Alexandrium_andersonii.AAC.1